MSTQPSDGYARQSSDEQPDGYARYNWWGRDDDHTPTTGHDTTDGPPAGYAADLAAWKAHDILRSTAVYLCGESLAADLEIELSPPSIIPPTDGGRVHFRRVRYNPETGAIAAGHGTWVRIKDRPRGEFMGLVELCIECWQADHGVSERGADALRSKADELKSRPTVSDEQILTQLIQAVVAPVPVTEYDW